MYIYMIIKYHYTHDIYLFVCLEMCMLLLFLYSVFQAADREFKMGTGYG